MEFAVNVPTSVGDSEHSSLPYCETISWDAQRTFATSLDDLGYDGIAIPDHLMTGNGATTECLTTLAALAQHTDDAYLYPKTVNNHLRHGPLLAKTAATLDNVSDGRLKLGMGAGWKTDEATAYGYDWPGAPDRLREMEETIVLMKELWSGEEVSFSGDYYELDEALCRPTPTQDPHPPIMVGGGGEEFTLRITAKHADAWNYWGSPDVIERKLDVLADHCERYDRPYDEIQKSWFARCVVRETREEVEALLEDVPRFREENLGDDETHLVGTPEEVLDQLEPYRDLGIEELVVEFVDFPETTGAELFAERVVPEL
ncbi:LLM class flavin-dependent oxidoreductase [Halorussus halobius]|uniref:LLM class flavin-dependent oxidoreductase n=1 Tax=Halorussus halobius TaxID=1710537 RepID=UPI0010920FD6|nr:LLM class flavin-dependent oxidoreductase [Halorussus halobius]